MSDQRKWTALLTGEQNGLIHQYGDKFHGSPDWYERVDVVPMARLTEIEVENKRLREALRTIAMWNERDDADLKVCRIQWRGCVAIAQAALAAAEVGDE